MSCMFCQGQIDCPLCFQNAQAQERDCPDCGDKQFRIAAGWKHGDRECRRLHVVPCHCDAMIKKAYNARIEWVCEVHGACAFDTRRLPDTPRLDAPRFPRRPGDQPR